MPLPSSLHSALRPAPAALRALSPVYAPAPCRPNPSVAVGAPPPERPLFKVYPHALDLSTPLLCTYVPVYFYKIYDVLLLCAGRLKMIVIGNNVSAPLSSLTSDMYGCIYTYEYTYLCRGWKPRLS